MGSPISTRQLTLLVLMVLAGCGGGTGSSTSGLSAPQLDGVYERTVSPAAVAKHDGVPVAQATAENYGAFTMVVRDGRFAFTQHNPNACTWQYGKLFVKGDRMDWFFTDGGGRAPNNAENKPDEHSCGRRCSTAAP
jgi:hypothetical protein